MCYAAILKRAEHRLTYLLSQVFKEETKRQKLCHIIGIKRWATLTQPHEEEGFPVAVVFPTRDPAQREANNDSVLVRDIRKPHSCTRVMPEKHLTAFITILHWRLFNTTSFVQVEIWNYILGPGCLGGVVMSTVTLQHEGLWLYSQAFPCGFSMGNGNTFSHLGDLELQIGRRSESEWLFHFAAVRQTPFP